MSPCALLSGKRREQRDVLHIKSAILAAILEPHHLQMVASVQIALVVAVGTGN